MDPAFQTRLVPDELWTLVEPMLPCGPLRPQGGGRPRSDARDVLIAIVYVLMADVSWRRLPDIFGVTPTVYRRYVEWHGAGVWRALLDATERQEGDHAAWACAIARAALIRAGRPPSKAARPVSAGIGSVQRTVS